MKNFKMFPESHGREPYTYLIYLIAPLIGAFFVEGIHRFVTLLLIILFVAIYRQPYWRDSYLLYIFLQALIIGYWVFMFGPTFFWLSAYSINSLASLTPKKRLTGIGIYVVIAVFTSVLKNYGSLEIILSCLPILINAYNTYVILSTRKWKESQQQLEKANNRIDELVKQQERQRIGRDLHDTLGQKLSMITLKTELAEKLLERNPSKAAIELSEVVAISRATLKQMRGLVEDLETGSLEEELRAGRQHLESAGIETIVYAEVVQMNRAYEKIAVMAMRELVTNVVKHSSASSCSIHVEQSVDGVMLRIEDNGVGIDRVVPNNGMLGLQSRMELINGTIQWRNSVDGTIVQIQIPLPQSVGKEVVGI